MPKDIVRYSSAFKTKVVSEIERGKPTVRVDALNRVLETFGKTLAVADLPKEARQ